MRACRFSVAVSTRVSAATLMFPRCRSSSGSLLRSMPCGRTACRGSRPTFVVDIDVDERKRVLGAVMALAVDETVGVPATAAASVPPRREAGHEVADQPGDLGSGAFRQEAPAVRAGVTRRLARRRRRRGRRPARRSDRPHPIPSAPVGGLRAGTRAAAGYSGGLVA